MSSPECTRPEITSGVPMGTLSCLTCRDISLGIPFASLTSDFASTSSCEDVPDCRVIVTTRSPAEYPGSALKSSLLLELRAILTLRCRETDLDFARSGLCGFCRIALEEAIVDLADGRLAKFSRSSSALWNLTRSSVRRSAERYPFGSRSASGGLCNAGRLRTRW